MIQVFAHINGETKATEISAETHEILRDACYLRNKSIGHILQKVVEQYKELSEQNILKYLDDPWVL